MTELFFSVFRQSKKKQNASNFTEIPKLNTFIGLLHLGSLFQKTWYKKSTSCKDPLFSKVSSMWLSLKYYIKILELRRRISIASNCKYNFRLFPFGFFLQIEKYERKSLLVGNIFSTRISSYSIFKFRRGYENEIKNISSVFHVFKPALEILQTKFLNFMPSCFRFRGSTWTTYSPTIHQGNRRRR